ncbi:dentin sialophosphoprotein-like [Haliotis asinina]|uniref:dentin sialophosphoprotein-like n=1 Tax=Haliotis asinina TaxID=109174 RepID=UPI003531EF7B
MNGCIIPGTDIAVDFWKIRKGPTSNLTFFLTHLHGDHIVGLTSSWSHPIYCTEVTAHLLEKRHGLQPKYLRPLEVGECHMITSGKMETICVTVIDANHCPGAAMFLFEGTFGKILHTGDFRYHPAMFCNSSPLFPHIERVDVLYLDNTFCSPECLFPSREEAQEQMLDIIRQHPEYDIIIGVRKLGKEELLVWLAEQLKEWISVNGDMFVLAEILSLPRVFRAQDSSCRIRTVPFQMISKGNLQKWNATKKTIAILPTSVYTGIGAQPFVNQENVFVVPYSDHSSYRELVEFVSKLKPASVVPIIHGDSKGPFNVSLKSRADMSVFDQYCQAQSNQRSCKMREEHVNEVSNVNLHHQARKPRLKKSRYRPHFKKSTQRGVEFESLELDVSDCTTEIGALASEERNNTSNKCNDVEEGAKENFSSKNKKSGINFTDGEGLCNEDEIPRSQGFEACHFMYLKHLNGRSTQSRYKQMKEDEGPQFACQEGVRVTFDETSNGKGVHVCEEKCIELQKADPSSECGRLGGSDVMDCIASERDFDETGQDDNHDDIAFGNTYLLEKDVHAGLERNSDIFQNDLHDSDHDLLKNEGDSHKGQGDLCKDGLSSHELESDHYKDSVDYSEFEDGIDHKKYVTKSDSDEAEHGVMSVSETSPNCKRTDSDDASGEQSESHDDSTPHEVHPSSVSTYKDSNPSVLSLVGHLSSRNTSKITSHSEYGSSVSVTKRQRFVNRFKRKRSLCPSSDNEMRDEGVHVDEGVHEDQFKTVSSPCTKRQRCKSSSDTDRSFSMDLQLNLSVKRVFGHPHNAVAQSKYNTVLCIQKWLDRHSSQNDG